MIRNQPLGVDLLPIWAGVHAAVERPADLYDFTAITHAQQWLLGAHSKIRPFIYPPSAVPVFLPFAVMDY